MKTVFDLIMETANLYSFLLNFLIDVYKFSDFDIADEEPLFSLEFSENSCIRQYVCTEDPSIKIDGMHINVVAENDVLTYKTSLVTNLAPNYKVTIKCSSLGYKDGFRVFTTKQDVLDECLRVENPFVKSAQAARLLRLDVVIAVMLARERRTATYCCTELAAALAALPSRPLEMVADAVVKTNGECSICNIETTQVLEEDDEEDDYYSHYYDYYLDDEEEYFRKHK